MNKSEQLLALFESGKISDLRSQLLKLAKNSVEFGGGPASFVRKFKTKADKDAFLVAAKEIEGIEVYDSSKGRYHTAGATLPYLDPDKLKVGDKVICIEDGPSYSVGANGEVVEKDPYGPVKIKLDKWDKHSFHKGEQEQGIFTFGSVIPDFELK